MKTILVATDFSEHAQIAGKCALALAKRLDAKLICMHASIMSETEPTAYELAHGQLEQFRQELQRQMVRKRKWLELYASEAARQGVQAQHHMIDGSPATAICVAAEELSADMVVVGSHGHTGLKRFFLGSVAESVVRHCQSSVLVARPPIMPESGFRNVLVPTDFGAQAERALVLARMLSADDATIDILHCWQLDELADGTMDPMAMTPVYASMSGEMMDSAKRQGAELVRMAASGQRKVSFHLHEGRPSHAVQSFIEKREQPYDLIAVGTHGRSGMSRLLYGSVAELTVRYSPCSVLVTRN